MIEENKRVLLGMSGGTDSSVAAMRLLEAGYEVIGVTFRFYELNGSTEYLEDARNLAERLGIRHITYDAREIFARQIIEYFVQPNAELVKDIHFPVHCKLALYPLGDAQYIDEIAKVWYMAQEEGLNPKTIHYATRIDGDVQDVFTYLTHVCERMENAPAVHHYVLHFTMNCNSPTEEN